MKKTRLIKHVAAGEYISNTKQERQTRENDSHNNNNKKIIEK